MAQNTTILNDDTAQILLEKQHSSIKREDEARILQEIPHKTRALAAKAATSRLSIRRLLREIKLLSEMIRNRNFSLQWKSKAIALAGLAYFLLPTDAIPDFIPFVGYIDDGAVIAAVLRMLASEIERYSNFKQS
ncbi:MAG: DUF1232 domain-containing protein [Bacteroidetes bacterium]|nr:DUF1232 domain-containing protein [Bacteroidota bacterium]